MSYNAADYLDKATILAACDQIDTYAVDYRTMGVNIENVSGEFGKDTLSIEGESLDALILEQASYIRDFEVQINALTNSVRSVVNQAYDALQTQLNEQKAADEAAAQAAANKN